MQAAGTVFHLLGALRRAIGRVILWFFLTGIVAAIVVEIVGFIASGQKGPGVLTNVVAAVIGLALAYSAALTVLVGEVIRFIVGSAAKAEKDVKADLSGGASFLDSALQTVEHREKK